MCDRRRKEGNRLTMKFMKRITSAALALLLTISCITLNAQAAEGNSSDKALSKMRDLVLQEDVKDTEQQPAIPDDEIVELIVEMKSAAGVDRARTQSAAEAAEDQALMEQVRS